MQIASNFFSQLHRLKYNYAHLSIMSYLYTLSYVEDGGEHKEERGKAVDGKKWLVDGNLGGRVGIKYCLLCSVSPPL